MTFEECKAAAEKDAPRLRRAAKEAAKLSAKKPKATPVAELKRLRAEHTALMREMNEAADEGLTTPHLRRRLLAHQRQIHALRTEHPI
jgi:streptomycin 6-kinase